MYSLKKTFAYTHDKQGRYKDNNCVVCFGIESHNINPEQCIIITFIDGIGIVEFSLWVNHLIGGTCIYSIIHEHIIIIAAQCIVLYMYMYCVIHVQSCNSVWLECTDLHLHVHVQLHY